MRAFAALLFALVPPVTAAAQTQIASPRAEAVSVTVYRDPDRRSDREMNLDWLGGYALITETRTIDLPAGSSDIRFEGVADTLLPASVIIRGLPQQPREQNYDARLLSPGALIDAHLGRQVHIRRTHRRTGKVTEGEAIIRSGPGGIVLQTSEGIEALRCTGLPETLRYDQVPEGLSDKPTLAIRASASVPTRATVQLSYLASQFDWQANYVASLAKDGRTLDLFAWLTLANSNEASFPQAQTNAVAGEPNREDDTSNPNVEPVSPEIHLNCWPSGNTSQVLAPPGISMIVAEDIGSFPESEIIVTGMRAPQAKMNSATVVDMIAAQEELGDLKLYRIPELVTVAANAQKQVALLAKDRVPYKRLYAIAPNADGATNSPQPVTIRLRMKNVKARGLGVPLPSGTVAVFEQAFSRELLVGEPRIEDKAVGEEVELDVGESPDVTYTQRLVRKEPQKDWPRRYEFAIANARPTAALIEVELLIYGDVRLTKPTRRLGLKNGHNFWRASVPANGRLVLGYTLEEARTRKVDGRGAD